MIEQGRVVALNLPAGKNPNLGRVIGVMLKQGWLGTLLLRPERMAKRPGLGAASGGVHLRRVPGRS